MKWCIDNEYELVELCPQRHDSDLEDEPFRRRGRIGSHNASHTGFQLA